MSGFRVEIIGEQEFNPREWLRRDALWASLMSPYDQQMKGWSTGTQLAQHRGNTNRQAIYGDVSQNDTEAQSMALFNQGKNIAGLVTSAALFTSYREGFRNDSSINLLEVQANTIDKVMKRLVRPLSKPVDEQQAYEVASRYVISNERQNPRTLP